MLRFWRVLFRSCRRMLLVLSRRLRRWEIRARLFTRQQGANDTTPGGTVRLCYAIKLFRTAVLINTNCMSMAMYCLVDPWHLRPHRDQFHRKTFTGRQWEQLEKMHLGKLNVPKLCCGYQNRKNFGFVFCIPRRLFPRATTISTRPPVKRIYDPKYLPVFMTQMRSLPTHQTSSSNVYLV